MSKDVSSFVIRLGTLCRVFFKNTEYRLFFDSAPSGSPPIPTSSTAWSFSLGHSLNNALLDGYMFSYVNILEGSFYKLDHSDSSTTTASYCALNVGKAYVYCLKCRANYPKTDHLCAPLATSASCTNIFTTAKIAYSTTASVVTNPYNGRDSYLYMP